MPANEEIQQTFIMLKPDAIERGLVGEIISRFEQVGLKLLRMETKKLSKETVARHYKSLMQKPFFPELEAYVTRGAVVATIWQGRDAIKVARKIVGATDPALAEKGTIRGDLGSNCTENLVHASDSPEAARSEIANFFGKVA